jgi:hypothetical protein
MRIYLHREKQLEAEAVDIPESATLAELLGEPAEGWVFLREDDEDALAPDQTLAKANVQDRSHIFAGKVRHLSVEVQFNGASKDREFPASAKVQRVFRWAVGNRGFDLDKADAAEHILSVAQAGDIPAPDVLIGSLPRDRPGHLLFNLVPKQRYEG